MTRYSRTAKYEELRNRIQNEKDGEISAPNLTSFEKRLNNINPNITPSQIKNPYDADAGNHVPTHAKSNEYVEPAPAAPEEPVVQPAAPAPLPQQNAVTPPFMDKNSGPYGSVFNNEYFDEYIKEVKQYNIEQGTAVSEDTTVNILQGIKDKSGFGLTPTRPFGEETGKTTEVPSLSQFNAQLKETKKAEPVVNTHVQDDTTANVPSFSKDVNQPSAAPSAYSNRADNIANEVQNLIKEQGTGPYVLPDLTGSFDTNTDTYELGRTTRQQLLNETTQIRNQLNDYDSHLEEVNERMRRNSQLINAVMITLIIALLVALAVVLYWIFTMRGL